VDTAFKIKYESRSRHEDWSREGALLDYGWSNNKIADEGERGPLVSPTVSCIV